MKKDKLVVMHVTSYSVKLTEVGNQKSSPVIILCYNVFLRSARRSKLKLGQSLEYLEHWNNPEHI